MYGFARKYTYNPLIGVFKKEDINDGLYKHQKELPGLIIEIEVSKEQYKKLKNLLCEFISNSDRYKYNTRGLFYTLLNKEVNFENRFLCSEFVYYILKESKIIDWDISPNLVRPQHLINLHGKIVYIGNLKKIKPTKYQRCMARLIPFKKVS